MADFTIKDEKGLAELTKRILWFFGEAKDSESRPKLERMLRRTMGAMKDRQAQHYRSKIKSIPVAKPAVFRAKDLRAATKLARCLDA